jgi:hypothetical protein
MKHLAILAAITAAPLVNIPIGGTMRLYHPTGPKLETVKCHPRMYKPLTMALRCIKESRLHVGILTYHGCYNYRNVRGTNRLSKHAHGLAIDINAGRPMPKIVANCFEAAGFTWGGRWPKPRTDPMHFELSWR